MPSSKKLSKNAIILEPHEEFKEAIVGVRKGHYVYCYLKLINVFLKHNEDWNTQDAVEWIDYNVAGLSQIGLKIRYPRN